MRDIVLTVYVLNDQKKNKTKIKGLNPYKIQFNARIAWLIYWKRLRKKDYRYEKNIGLKIAKMIPVVFVVGKEYDFGLHAMGPCLSIHMFKLAYNNKKYYWEPSHKEDAVDTPMKPCERCFRPSYILFHCLGHIKMRCLRESEELRSHQYRITCSKHMCCDIKYSCDQCVEVLLKKNNWEIKNVK